MTTKIYTRTGDAGDTGLFGGGRVPKDHPRVTAYGEIDELNAVIGMARSVEMMPRIDEVLAPVQRDLFALGALLATPDQEKMKEQGVAPKKLGEILDKVAAHDNRVEDAIHDALHQHARARDAHAPRRRQRRGHPGEVRRILDVRRLLAPRVQVALAHRHRVLHCRCAVHQRPGDALAGAGDRSEGVLGSASFVTGIDTGHVIAAAI